MQLPCVTARLVLLAPSMTHGPAYSDATTRAFSAEGLHFSAFQFFYSVGTVVSCEVPDDCVEEGSSVTVTCTRSLDLSEQSRIQVNTEDGSATGLEFTTGLFRNVLTHLIAPADYTTLNIPENRPSFFAGNILNYRGGARQDSVISFDIQTTADSDDTEPQETFFLNVSPVRTAVVLTPRVPITICGGMN